MLVFLKLLYSIRNTTHNKTLDLVIGNIDIICQKFVYIVVHHSVLSIINIKRYSASHDTHFS